MKLFVTVGTTSFDELIKSVNSQKVLDFLVEMGFDEIVYQIGRGSYIPCNPLNSQSNETFHYKTLKISYYKYKDSLGPEITSSDLIIGHAGAGTILEALRAEKPLIVIINTELMNNHQIEIATGLGKDNYLLHGTKDEVLELLEKHKSFKYQKYPKPSGNTFLQEMNKLFNI